eukprot:scaffold1474_cov132-Cylindrotheca_fusiformis.AAC.9
MTSMLTSFAWRKSHYDPYMHSITTTDELEFSSPGVSESSSGDTLNSMVEAHMPQTPEGLRTRKTVASIRQELGLPQPQLDWIPLPTAPAIEASPARSVLPPIQSTNLVDSPQVSTSSFYSRSTYSPNSVARSPSLVVGQAKTAVGALLAMSESRHSLHGAENSIRSSGSILPPKNLDCAHNATNTNVGKRLHDDNSYHSSMASQSILPTPRESGDVSFSHASPSSNYNRNAVVDRYEASKLETSFSRSFMLDRSRELYNVPDMEGNDLYVPRFNGRAHDLNVSGISHSTKDVDSLYSLADIEIQDEESISHDEDMIRSDRQDLQSLSFSKIQGQRYDRDDLLFSALERLQDEHKLVLQILDEVKQAKAPPDYSPGMTGQNLFNGFFKENREKLSRFIDEIVNDKPSMFQRISEQTRDFEEALGFAGALVRTAVPESEKTMKLQSSVAGHSQQGSWKCVPGFRASIGLMEEPKSPATLRGGDTSLFSLPSESACDSTPHTSNVSATTTITSAFSPEKQNFGFHKKDLRETTETIISLFDRLGAACSKLMGEAFSGSSVSITAAEEITRIYIQLQTVSVDRLEGLVDSFELEVQSVPFSRLIANGQGEEGIPLNDATAMVPALTRNISNGEPISSARQLDSQVVGPLPTPEVVEEKGDRGEGNSIFSPCTADMMSVGISTRSSDDLRRVVGSFDEADIPEERDPPQQSFVPDQHAISNEAKKKSRRTKLWKRRLVPRKKTTE